VSIVTWCQVLICCSRFLTIINIEKIVLINIFEDNVMIFFFYVWRTIYKNTMIM